MAKVFKLFSKGIVLKPVNSGPNPCSCDPTDNIEGSFWINGNELRGYIGAGVRVIVSEDQTQVLTNKTITIDDCKLTLVCMSNTVNFAVNIFQECAITTVQLPKATGKTLAVTDGETHTGATSICSLTVCMNLIVCGTLLIKGATTTLNTACITVEDKNIIVNKNCVCACANGSGITVCTPAACTTDGSIIYNKDIPCGGGSFWKAGKVGSESEIITAAFVQTITGNKTFSGCNVLSGKISGGTIDGSVNVDLTSGQITLPNFVTACIPCAAANEGELFYSTDDNKIFFHNGTIVEQLGGSGVSFQTTQTAHGLALRDAIYFKCAVCEWQKAQANAAGTLATYIVTNVISACKFEATKFDRVTFPCCHFLTIGSTYYNSISSPGAAVTPAPVTCYVSPLFFVEDAKTIHITVHNPVLIGCGIAEDSEIGAIMAFGIPLCCAPTGFLAANGQSVSRTTYACLFAKIGTAYGSASGSTFNMPDLRGKFLRGLDNAAGNDPGVGARTAANPCGATGDNVGSIQGCAICCHTHDDNFSTACDAHNHTVVHNTTGLGTSGNLPSALSANCAGTIPTTCDTHNHTINGCVGVVTCGTACVGETRPLNVSVNYFIRFAAKGAILGIQGCQTIPCVAISWCSSSAFHYKTVSAGTTTYTFTNDSNGQEIKVAHVNSCGTCAGTVNFPAAVQWTGGTAVTSVPANSTNVYTLTKINCVIYAEANCNLS